MHSKFGNALLTFGILGSAGALSVSACSSEDPAPQTSTSTGETTGSTATLTSGATATSAAAVTSSATTQASGMTATSTTGAAVTGTTGSTSGAGGSSATVTSTSITTATTSTASPGAGGSTTAGDATATGSTTGASLTDEQCQGISNGAECTTEGTCAPRACGLADTGSRTCSCAVGDDECTTATCWDCTSCAWQEPYPDIVVPPESALAACDAGVADEVACTTMGDRCMQGEEVCACWLEDDAGTGYIWDCDKPPSFWP